MALAGEGSSRLCRESVRSVPSDPMSWVEAACGSGLESLSCISALWYLAVLMAGNLKWVFCFRSRVDLGTSTGDVLSGVQISLPAVPNIISK